MKITAANHLEQTAWNTTAHRYHAHFLDRGHDIHDLAACSLGQSLRTFKLVFSCNGDLLQRSPAKTHRWHALSHRLDHAATGRFMKPARWAAMNVNIAKSQSIVASSRKPQSLTRSPMPADAISRSNSRRKPSPPGASQHLGTSEQLE
jgi:hypothetical protein